MQLDVDRATVAGVNTSSNTVIAMVSTLLIVLAAIASATVAVVTGHIDGQTYTAIVAGVTGATIGAGAHAAGVNSATSPTP